MNLRPLKLRCGARVLLLAGEEVLLLNDSDPGIPGSSWWVAPGGGIDAGETPEEAACREVEEETGLHLNPADLIGPVAQGRVCHGYSDRIRVQDDLFFLARVRRFEPSSMGWTDSEKKRVKGFAGGGSTPCRQRSGRCGWPKSPWPIPLIPWRWRTGRSRRCR